MESSQPYKSPAIGMDHWNLVPLSRKLLP